MDFQSALDAVLAEVGKVAGRVKAEQVGALAAGLETARQVILTGEGRSALVAKALAVRLLQLGFKAFIAGEATAPPVREGDLLVAVSGSGETPVTCHFAEVARSAGAKVAAVVCQGDSRLGKLADTALVVPGRVKTGAGVDSVQIPGALFEQAAFVVLDALVMVLQEMRGETHESMSKRHTNLE